MSQHIVNKVDLLLLCVLQQITSVYIHDKKVMERLLYCMTMN